MTREPAVSDAMAHVPFGDGTLGGAQRWLAGAVALAVTLLTVAGGQFSALRGAEIAPFITIVATFWSGADGLTAFLLMAQFAVRGSAFFLILGIAYELSALLTVPYLAFFPGAFRAHLTLGEQQISADLWTIWHCTFPLLVTAAVLADPKLERCVPPRARIRAILAGALGTLAVAGVFAASAFALRDLLPPLIANGHFTIAFKFAVLPVVIAVNAAACARLLLVGRRLTSIQLWLAIALLTAALDAVVQEFAPTRGSLAWDAGKIETVLTATIVLAAMFGEIIGVYDRLAHLARAALAATEAKSQFLATMSHELRTPMNGVVAMTEVLLGTPLDRRQQECALIVRESSQSLLRILDSILDYSKVEAGKIELESVRFEIPAQVASVIALLGPQFNKKDVGFTARVAPEAELSVIGDPGRVRQVLLNLVGNALKFTPTGGRVEIRASAGALRDDGTTLVTFAVSDTGVGVAADAVDTIFAPFRQADASTTRQYGGTGLGLSISRQLVELMGGEIGVESAPDHGSLFWFRLPFAAAQRCGTQASGEQRVTRRAALRVTSRARILVVDDNEINLRVATEQFRQLGHEITPAASGLEALAALEHETFDLVFMDCRMPGMDGLDATREIRRRETGGPRRVPIVALTADCGPADQQACSAAGMDDYLAKPASLEGLRAATDRWLQPRSTLGML